MTEPESNLFVAQARFYVRAFRAFDLTVTAEATMRVWEWIHEDGQKDRRSFSEWLGLTMNSFNLADGFSASADPAALRKSAFRFVSMVDRGLTSGFVRQGQGIITKWEEAERANEEYKNKLRKLIGHYRRCAEDRLALENQISSLGQNPITIASVQSKVEEVFDPKEFDEFEDN